MRAHWSGAIFAAALSAAQAGAWAQTSPAFTAGGTVFGRNNVQWNTYFATKVDTVGGAAQNLTITGTLNLTNATVLGGISSISVASTTIAGYTLNGLLFANTGGVLGNLATADSGILVTNSSGVPSISTTAPSGLTIPAPTISGAAALTGVPVLSGLSAGTCASALAINSSNQAVLVACPGAAASVAIGSTEVTGGGAVANGLLYNAAGVIGNLATIDNGVLVTTGSGVPVIATTLPGGLSAPSFTVTTAFIATGLVTNADLANSTISGISLGSNLSTLTFGTHLASGGSSYNGAAGVTITSDATNANTASTIVARDGSGNFSAGTITASLTGHSSLDCLLAGCTMSGPIAMGANAITNTAGVTLTAGAATPALNTGLVFGEASVGLGLIGNGGASEYDIVGYNKNLQVAFYVPDATENFGVESNLIVGGAVTSGAWQGTAVAVGYGGTNCTSASVTCLNNITGLTYPASATVNDIVQIRANGSYFDSGYLLSQLLPISSTTLYVKTTGTDGPQCGLTSGTACLTLQAAVAVAQKYDLGNNSTIVLNVGAGTFNLGVVVSGVFKGSGTGYIGGTVLSIQGAGSGSTIIDDTESTVCNPINVSFGAHVSIQGMELETTCAAGADTYTTEFGLLEISGDILFGNSPIASIWAQDHGLVLVNPASTTVLNFAANTEIGILLENESSLRIFGSSSDHITFTGDPTFSVAFADIINNSTLKTGGVGYSGTMSGPFFSIGESSSWDNEQTPASVPSGASQGGYTNNGTYYQQPLPCVGGAAGCGVTDTASGLGTVSGVAGTVTVYTGSSDRSGIIVLNAGAGASSSGAAFIGTFGQMVGCSGSYGLGGSAALNGSPALFQYGFYGSGYGIEVAWYNLTPLVNGDTYYINYTCSS